MHCEILAFHGLDEGCPICWDPLTYIAQSHYECQGCEKEFKIVWQVVQKQEI